MHLVVQLNSTELPDAVSTWTGPGIFQMFYCLSDCEGEVDGWAPYSSAHCARRIDLDADGAQATAGRSVPARAIVGWIEAEDAPHYEERMTPNSTETPREGDKLAGWPAWVQGAEYPSCRLCGAPMRVLFQVDSNDNLDWMWGDMGCAHLSVCLEHTDQLAFGWACC